MAYKIYLRNIHDGNHSYIEGTKDGELTAVNSKEYVDRNEALQQCRDLRIIYPISDYVVVNMDNLEIVEV